MRTRLFFIAAALVAFSLIAHEHEHGAADLGNIGKAHLVTSCNAAAQKQIDRAVALIHSFWYGEAEKSFRRAAEADPQCGMAWWGVAMSNLHPLWAPPNANELKTGVEAAGKAKNIGAKTDRERAYIDAINAYYTDSDKLDHRTRMVAYEKSMDALAAANPKDREAAIFHALSLLGIADAKDKTYANQKNAGEILNRMLRLEPQHPGIAHYIIHSFDYPELANLALPAARNYAKLAPGSPHALHMPSHIFTRLGLWDESISSNLASAEKARNYVAHMMPGATSFEELHAVDYLVYAYLQRGENDKALKLLQRLNEVAKVDTPNFAAGYAVAAVPARYALERRQWKEAAALTLPGSNLSWEKFPYAEANIHFAVAIGAARSNQPEIAQRAIDRLAAIHQALVDQKDRYWSDQVEIQRLGASGWLAAAKKQDDEALKQMRAAADLEASTEKHPVTPGAVIPARELLSEMLLEMGKPDESLAEAERALRDAPNRYHGLWLAAQAAERAGKTEMAKSYRAKMAALRSRSRAMATVSIRR
jgi:tetratricopeptide (TPR) repeat protein